MKTLKIITISALAGIGAAQVLRWLDLGVVHILLMSPGAWSVEQAAKAAPWILAALAGGLALSLYSMACDNERYTRSPYGKVDGFGARTKQDEDKEMGA